VVSDYGTLTLESFYQSIFNMSPGIYSEYLRPLSSGSFLFLPQGAIRETNTPQHPLIVLSVLDSNSTRYGNLFIFLDEKQMMEDIEQLLNNDDMEYYLFDGEGQLIVSNCTAYEEELPQIMSRLRTDSTYQDRLGRLFQNLYAAALIPENPDFVRHLRLPAAVGTSPDPCCLP
jgi:hypothetical protein